MKNVVFLVKNGIGFGHIRRALLLAEALAEREDMRPVVISQAHSLDLYRMVNVRVVNFPLLHRVPSAITEDCYLDLLDRLLARLQPDVVVEDTYPDPRYGRVPSLTGVPRVLVMRRLDGLSFDQLRSQGAFSRYSDILIAQYREDCQQEGHSGDSFAAIEASLRVRFVGNIHVSPPKEAIAKLRSRYCPGSGQLVVVNGGAGGDQAPDGYGDRLFSACARIADQYAAEQRSVRFAFVTGPYYAGRTLRNTVNVTVTRFESHLPALLAAADVAVIKPGNNVLSETLCGTARLVLVPDNSFMEGLDEHAARVAAQHGGVVTSTDISSLSPAIQDGLAEPPRQPTDAHDAMASLERVVNAIVDRASAPTAKVSLKDLTILIRDDSGVWVWSDSTEDQQTATHVPLLSATSLTDTPSARYVLADDVPEAGVSPRDLLGLGMRALISPSPHLSPAINHWLRRAVTEPSLLTLTASPLTAETTNVAPICALATQLLHRQARATVLVDIRKLHTDSATTLRRRLDQWLHAQPVRVASLDDQHAAIADRLLDGEGGHLE